MNGRRGPATHEIDFETLALRAQCREDQSLLEAARQVGLDLVSICGGQGTCHRCKLQVLTGRVSPITLGEQQSLSPQELANGYRLACQTRALGHCRINVPSESLTTLQRAQVEGLEVSVAVESPVKAYRLTLPSPLHSDPGARREVLLKGLLSQHQIVCNTVDVQAMQSLLEQPAPSGGQIQASVRGDEVVDLGHWPSPQLGLAIDLGTTKIAGYLLDLANGRTLASQGVPNPQAACGEDIITRIALAKESPSDGIRFHELAMEAMNGVAADLCTKAKVKPEDIVEAVVVGNTAMHHLVLRLPLGQLLQPPFTPTIKEALDIKARDLGLRVAPGAYVHFLPNVAGFVGADHVAMLLATGVWQSKGVIIALDIGTNTEVSLVSNGEIASASCASGPAFEGGHIKCGMKAAPGAIERLRLLDNRVEYQTIGGGLPTGICGSGIIDAVSQLYLAGVLDAAGRMHDHPLVRGTNGQREFVLVNEEERGGHPAITITQHDVREVQLAKGAILAGIQVLMQSKGIAEQGIEQVVIAGAFGSYLDLTSAVTIGMLPPLPLDRFRQVGNAAGMGAKMALISISKRLEAQTLARRIQYIELASAPGFMQTFAKATSIGFGI
ncbi:MAG: ASKHA domain-containing protein [Chloroflexi bacterium]|nr:ASKHA domain-containing protein [Chloroflexota bacterium]